MDEYEYIGYLSEILTHVIMLNGPTLIAKDVWEAGIPDTAQAVVIEETQEGYLVFITDKTPEEMEAEHDSE